MTTDDYPKEFTSAADPTVESIGPFRRWPLVVNGYSVPKVQLVQESGDTAMFIVDNRLAHEVPVEQAAAVAHLVANAIAVTLGHGHHPNAPFAPGDDEPPPPRVLRPWKHYVGMPDAPTDGPDGPDSP